MKKIIYLLFTLICSISISAQSVKGLLVLDNYTIPVGKKGALVGKVISPNNDKISLAKDASKLFSIDKQGNISLKKGKELTLQSPISYEITIKNGKEYKTFELVKDNFVQNKVIAHRGAWKKHDVSHNSMSSLKYAIELGCEGSEIDVWMSSDDVVVLSHDPSIGGKRVEETTAEELTKIALKQGDFVPTLQETIEYIKKQNKTKLVIEIKGTEKGKPIADSVIYLVHRMHAQGWVNYIAFGLEHLVRVKELDPTAEVAYLGSDKTLEELKAADMTGIDFHYNLFFKDTELAEKAKKIGLSTNVWTVNKKEDMNTMLNQHVDYITTDEPELLFNIIEKE
ncbi:MAG: glycerophosphodiester phosphodiesterase [Dysgonomonas sp.]